MKLLVTGGAGFIGSNFILYWLKRYPDDQIINFDALTYAGNLENLCSIEQSPRYTFRRGDITDSAAVADVMRGVDTIVHFAAESHVDRSIHNPHDFVHTNVVGTQILLDEALKNNVKRFHHVSTDEVYGSLLLDEKTKFDEFSPYNPHSPYSASKAASDFFVRAYHHTYGLGVTISNCSNNYGPYQFPEKFIPLMIINALQDKPLPIYGDGLNIRDWIHVEDHARAVDLIIHHGTSGSTYCVGGEAERTNKVVAETILKIIHKPQQLLQFVQDRPGHDQRYAIDNKKIEHELGFTPKHSFEKGIVDTVAWYQQNSSWWQAVLNEEYRTYYEKQYAQR